MERVRDPTLGPISHRPSSSTHFHSLYVKRHRNVRYVRTHSDTIIWEPEGRYQYLNNIGCPWVVYQIYCIHLAECNISGIPQKKANIIIIILDLDLKHCTNETTKKRKSSIITKLFTTTALLEAHWGNNRICVVTMHRSRISSYAHKVGVVLARRAIIVNKIHDVTMYNASSQSNALNALDPEFLRMRI